MSNQLVECPDGHANHVTRSVCLVCGQPLSPAPPGDVATDVSTGKTFPPESARHRGRRLGVDVAMIAAIAALAVVIFAAVNSNDGETPASDITTEPTFSRAACLQAWSPEFIRHGFESRSQFVDDCVSPEMFDFMCDLEPALPECGRP